MRCNAIRLHNSSMSRWSARIFLWFSKWRTLRTFLCIMSSACEPERWELIFKKGVLQMSLTSTRYVVHSMLPLNVNIGIFLKEGQSWVCFQSVASCEGRLHLINMTSPLNLTVKEGSICESSYQWLQSFPDAKYVKFESEPVWKLEIDMAININDTLRLIHNMSTLKSITVKFVVKQG